MSKKSRIIVAVVWGILTLPTAFFAMVLFGLARMDTGSVNPEPQLLALWALPVVLLVSCIAELMLARGADTRSKAGLAKVFAFLPVGNILIIAVLILAR
ncbi:MAG: hypothetical protein KBD50_02210 [Candidatus Pacebacteria bacterium]|nr:hypothetical protein [Candidatus Paceibacterota bacterium]